MKTEDFELIKEEFKALHKADMQPVVPNYCLFSYICFLIYILLK